MCVWGGGVHAHVHGCARCMRVCGMGWGCTHVWVRNTACVYVGWGGVGCAIQHVCMCLLNTGCSPDSINFVIIVILCSLKLKFAIHDCTDA